MEIRYRCHLPELMRSLNLPMTAVELGVAEGLFAADLMNRGIMLLYLVDNWDYIPGQLGDGGSAFDWHLDNYRQVVDRMAVFDNREQKYKILKGLSVEMAKEVPDETLGLVNVDCDHSYEGVSSDIQAWFPKLVMGGIMAFHDYENPAYGVKKAVTEFCTEKGYTIHLIPEGHPDDAGAYFIKY